MSTCCIPPVKARTGDPVRTNPFLQAAAHRDHSKIRLYVIGPVTGMPNLNLERFQESKDMLTAAGYEVLIPHDFIPSDSDWLTSMSLSLDRMHEIDGIALIEKWDASFGALIEYMAAEMVGIPVHPDVIWAAYTDDSDWLFEDCQNRANAQNQGEPESERITPAQILKSSEPFSGFWRE